MAETTKIITLYVRNKDGKPLSGATVKISGESGEQKTDKQGKAEIVLIGSRKDISVDGKIAYSGFVSNCPAQLIYTK